jgi:hypothetical protein
MLHLERNQGRLSHGRLPKACQRARGPS